MSVGVLSFGRENFSTDVSMYSVETDKSELFPILRSIVVSRCKEGATIDEIIADYEDHTGGSLLAMFRDKDEIATFLRQIPGVWSVYSTPYGPYVWFCITDKTQHLVKMIQNQKPPANKYNYYPMQQRQYHPLQRGPGPDAVKPSENDKPKEFEPVASGSGTQDKFFKDNINYIPQRGSWNRKQQQRVISSHPYYRPPQQRQSAKSTNYRQYFSKDQCFGPNLCGYQMIGDDFFLSLARWELGFTFDQGHKIQRSGLCISGLTIAEAAERVMKARSINDRVMVNVGAVDLLHGHDFMDMQEDMHQLFRNLKMRGATDIIVTTVSPLASSSHIVGITAGLHQFNKLILKSWPSIDLWRSFVDENEHTLYALFQPGPRHVSGSLQPHVLWNKVGRRRIIKFLKTKLGEFA